MSSQQKYSAIVLLSGWSLELFERPSYVGERKTPIIRLLVRARVCVCEREREQVCIRGRNRERKKERNMIVQLYSRTDMAAVRHWQIYQKNYHWPTRDQIRKVYGGRTWCSIEPPPKKQKNLKKQNRKALGLNEIPPEIWKTRKFDNVILWLCNAVYKKYNKEMDTRLHPSLSQERWSRNLLRTK